MNQDESFVHDHTAPPGKKRSPYRRAIIVSIFVHIVLAVVLLCWYLPSRNESSPTASSAAGNNSDDQQQASARKSADEVLSERIEQTVEAKIEQAQQLSDEEKLSELEKNLRRLESMANEQSVQDVTTKIASTLGLNQDHYQADKQPAAGPFDADSAQLQDVSRRRAESGDWQYECELVDAAGRTMTVPLTAAEGETVYNTFQQMKKFPLAEGIYRSVVMPLIQKMLD